MRKIPKLTKPEKIERQFVLTNFNDYTNSSKGIIVSENGLSPLKNYTFQDYINWVDLDLVKFYNFGQAFICYDGFNMLEVSEDIYHLNTSDLQPVIQNINENGKNAILMLIDNPMVKREDGQYMLAYNIPYGKYVTVFNGRLFVANNNRLWFSKANDFYKFTLDFEGGGFVDVDSNDGEIIALIPTEDCIIVVCEKTIYKFYPFGDRQNFSIVRQDILISARAGSVRKIDDAVYMFNYDSLYVYKNSSLKKIDYDFNGLTFDGEVGVDNTIYYASLTDGQNRYYLLRFDTMTGEICVIPTNKILIVDNGYFYIDKKIQTLSSLPVACEQIEWQSVNFNFDSAKIKTLVGIEIKSNCSGSLELECSYAKQTYDFEGGLTLIKTFVSDFEFKLKVSLASLQANVEQIKFIYRLQEE